MVTVAVSDEDGELPDGLSARASNSTSGAVSPARTICAECETYYEKMYGMPETISTTTRSFVMRSKMYKVHYRVWYF